MVHPSSPSFLNDLNPVQQEAVQAVDGPVIIVAGAGSGKTRVLTYRIAYLISMSIPAYRILALTFTNKAAGEMKNRIVQLVGEKSRQVWMGTFHSTFARILRRESGQLGFTRNFSIYDTDDSLQLIKNVQHSLGISTHQFNPHAIRAKISEAKNHCVPPEDFAAQAADLFEEKTAHVYKEYQTRLKQFNAMDFDDLLLKPIELFQHNKKILQTYQQQFQYILVDEYQDTNRAQFVVLKLLAEKHRNICVVGDDAQSIYAFRGADLRNMLEFEQEFPGCRMFRLEQNYRSTKTILSAADVVIKNNVQQIQKNLWTANSDGEPVVLLICTDDKDEGACIVRHLQHEITTKKLDLKQIAVLYRTNAQSRSLEDAMRRNGLPYVIVGGVEFYKRKEIKDILAYARLIVNWKDDESLLRIINVPARGLGDTTVEHVKQFAVKQKSSLWEAIVQLCGSSSDLTSGKLSPHSVKNLQKFHDLIRKYIRLHRDLSPSELVRILVDDLGVLRDLKEEGTLEALTRWENLQELLSAISEYTTDRPHSTLEDFLEEVSLISDVDKWDENRNTVTLMTIHAAKGLEFPVVFIAGLEEGLLPFYNAIVDQKELEEERRLFYVAMTRAKSKLFLSCSHMRYRFGNVSYQVPSRFLEEIDPGLLQVEQGGRPLSSLNDALSKEGEPRDRRGVLHQGKTPSGQGKMFEDEYFSDQHDDEIESQVVDRLRKGARVEHEVFGRGTIIELSGRGEFAKAVVDFQTVGRKHLLLKYARLRVL